MTGRDSTSTSDSGNAWAGLRAGSDSRAGKRANVTRALDGTTKRCVVIRAMQLYVGDMRT